MIDPADRQHRHDARAVDDHHRPAAGRRRARRQEDRQADRHRHRRAVHGAAQRWPQHLAVAVDHRRRRHRSNLSDAAAGPVATLRRQAKRAAPACVSPLSIVARPRRASLRVAASRSRSHCSIADSRSLRMHCCGKAANSRASSTATANASPGAATRLTSPIRSASVPSTPATGEEQVHRPAVADETGQVDRPTVDEWNAEATAEHAEDGVRGGHTEVAPQGQLQPSGHGRTLDGGDHRFGQAEPGRAHRTGPVVGRPDGDHLPASAWRSAPAQK